MIPWRSVELYVILSLSLSAVMGVSLISPTLPVLQDVFGLSDVEAGYVITLYTLPAIFLAPLAGLLTDWFGRRAVVVPSLLIFGGAGFSIALVDSFALLGLLRFVQGVGSTSLALISRTLVGDRFEGRAQNAVMGLNDAVLALGAAFYPVIGGYLAGWEWYYPFLLYTFPCAVSLGVFLLLPKIPLKKTRAAMNYLKDGLGLLTNPKILLLLGATFTAFVLLYGGIQTMLPLYFYRTFHYGSDAIGTFISTMAVMIAVTSFFNGQLVKLVTSRTLILVGFGFYAGGLLVLGSVTGTPWLLAGLVLFGVGHGLTLPSMNTSLVRSVETESRGGLMSLRTILSRGGQTVGPFLFPLLGTRIAYDVLFIGAGLITVGLVLFTLLTYRPG